MGWILRKSTDKVNPTLPGGVYGKYITAGRGVYWKYEGGRVHFILFISDGGKYGMNDPDIIEYKSVALDPAEYKFHPGTYTKQVEVLEGFEDNSNNKILLTAHGLTNGTALRFVGSQIPEGITNAKVWVVNATADDFQLSSTAPPTTTLIDFDGIPFPGTVYFYVANAGFDDPVQGLSTFCPEIDTTLSGICYLEGKIPSAYVENEEPDWQDFRVAGVGRKLMDYDDEGTELGVTTDPDLCCNPALADADCILVEYKNPSTRIDWPSWKLLRDDSEVSVIQRGDSEGVSSKGFIGKYYSYTVADPPTIGDGTLRASRRDLAIDFDWPTDGPGMGLPPDKFMVVWEAQLKPKYSEDYVFSIEHDNGARVYVDGVLVIDQWTTLGTHTSSGVTLVADTLVDLKVEFWEGGGPGECKLRWSSPTQASEIISANSTFEPDTEVRRYEFNGAYPKPMEAAIVHEEILLRCPGWDWTDVNGKITYLPPDRPSVFEFVFDVIDDNVESTIIDKSFEKNRKHRRDRKNFVLYSYRNTLLTGYPEEFVEENRPRLRELGGGVPTNDLPEELMVMSRSLAQRYAFDDMSFNVDPPYEVNLSGGRPSGIVTKNVRVTVRNLTGITQTVEESDCIVRSVERRGNILTFSLIPVTLPFYTDEEA